MTSSAGVHADPMDSALAGMPGLADEIPVAPQPIVLPPTDRAPEQPIVESQERRGVSDRERLYRRALAVSDVVAVVFAFLLIGGAPTAIATWAAAAVLAVATIVGSKLYGLYDRDDLVVRKTTLEEAPRIFHLAVVAVLALWMAEDFMLDEPMRRTEAVLFGATLVSLALLGRRAARTWCQRRTGVERCILIGDIREYDRLARTLEDSANATLVACLPLRDAYAGIDHRTGSVDALRLLIRGFDAHRVIVATEDGAGAELIDVVRGAKRVGVRVSLLPRVTDVVGTLFERDEIAGLTLLGMRRFGLTRSSDLLKRALDVAGSVFALALLSPLMALIALAIRIDSAGPVFFRQRRIGQDNEPFEILKFRTMVADAEARKAELLERNEAEGLFKIADDPRITRVGKLLRATSLDELPQLFNVLRGDMSLVGPRPLIVDEDSMVFGFDRRRLHLKPGMTGPWQIAGSARVPLTEMVKIDYRYVAEWSVWSDLKILLRTVPFMLARRGM